MNDDMPSLPGDSGAEAALRQLRLRYDELRTDYESLLARLADLEEAAEAPPPVPEPVRPAVFELMLSPLATLRDEYLGALDSLQRLIGGLDDLLPRGMKSQRSSPGASTAGGRRVQIDVRGHSPGELLDFRERLAGIDGVETVSIHAIDAERVVLVVQLA